MQRANVLRDPLRALLEERGAARRRGVQAPRRGGTRRRLCPYLRAAPDYVQNMEAINNQYNIESLPIKIEDRVRTAVRAFDSYTERRPIVVVVDVAYWWAGSHMGWWKRWDEDLGSRKKFAAKLDEYMEDMDALVRLVDKEMKKIGRPYALVGKSNHNRGFRKGTVNFKFMVEMGEAVKLVFKNTAITSTTGVASRTKLTRRASGPWWISFIRRRSPTRCRRRRS